MNPQHLTQLPLDAIDGIQRGHRLLKDHGDLFAADMQNYPYLTTIPGIAISLTVLAVNWIGDGIRDAFDPKLRA